MSKPAFKDSDFTGAHLKKATVNAHGGVDPKAQAEYEKVFTECGGNYDKIGERLGVKWAPRAIKPGTAKQFVRCSARRGVDRGAGCVRVGRDGLTLVLLSQATDFRAFALLAHDGRVTLVRTAKLTPTNSPGPPHGGLSGRVHVLRVTKASWWCADRRAA